MLEKWRTGKDCVALNGGQVIMTARAKQEQEQVAMQWQDATRNFEHWPTPRLAITFSPWRWQREQALVFFSGSDCVLLTQWIVWWESVSRRGSWTFLTPLPRLAHESGIERCSPRERRSDKIQTCCRQWHDSARCTYTHTVAFSPSVLINCSIWDTDARSMIRSRKRIHGVWHTVIASFASRASLGNLGMMSRNFTAAICDLDAPRSVNTLLCSLVHPGRCSPGGRIERNSSSPFCDEPQQAPWGNPCYWPS